MGWPNQLTMTVEAMAAINSRIEEENCMLCRCYLVTSPAYWLINLDGEDY